MIMAETFLKAKILTSGVSFSDTALEYALKHNAKKQNMVYNAPVNADRIRPQELFITHCDGYRTVVSCVAPCSSSPVQITVEDEKLVAKVENRYVEDVDITFVQEPSYYQQRISRGTYVKEFVSACGYDELNIIPWRGCDISKGCLFCGSNAIAAESEHGTLTAHMISISDVWEKKKDTYLRDLTEAVHLAKKAACYKEHMHVIIISGDLCDEKLDYQAEIYAQIAEKIYPEIREKAKEGVVAVLMPPKNFELLKKMSLSGIDKVVFNLEVGNENLFNQYCPGKRNIGYRHILNALSESVDIWGTGNVWTNFVLGLEPIDGLLALNARLAKEGIVSSANVLHLDKGNRLDCQVPSYDTVIKYFYELASVLKENNQLPFYCSQALRTSLSNETYEGRITL